MIDPLIDRLSEEIDILIAENERLTAAIAVALEPHQRDTHRRFICVECLEPYPCTLREILEQSTGTQGREGS